MPDSNIAAPICDCNVFFKTFLSLISLVDYIVSPANGVHSVNPVIPATYTGSCGAKSIWVSEANSSLSHFNQFDFKEMTIPLF